MNKEALCKQTNLTRQQLIKVWTQFVSVYMDQQLQSHTASATLKLDSLVDHSLSLKIQSPEVVAHMLHVLSLQPTKRQEISWDNLTDKLAYLMPKTMSAKLEIFLRSLVGRDLTEQEYDMYCFSQQDILQLCRSALHVLGTRDQFFEELSLNFAKFIYIMIDRKWSDTSPIPLQLLSSSFKKANDNDKKILFLVYGSIGIMSVPR